MALQTHFLSSSFTNKHTLLLFSSTLTVRSHKPSESSKPTTDSDDTPPVSVPVPPKDPGLGFGPSNLSKPKANAAATSKRKQKGQRQRERTSIIRRSPVEKPAFVSEKQVGEDKEQSKNESAFILAWLCFGAIILVEGIALAASGFLPEEWDKFFVKYLYPSFTPTVFLFVAGAVAYGVLKFLQNEKITGQK